MFAFSSRQSRAKAFTLIELLVVIGIIGVLVGVLAGVLGGGGQSSAMQAAQGTMSSLLSSARAQAALSGRDAAIAVNYDYSYNSDRYLRYCVVIVKDSSGAWVTANEGYYLPTGVYVVPNAPLTSNDAEAGVTFGAVYSSGFDGTLNAAFNSTKSEKWLVLGINALGQRVNAANGAAVGAGTYVVLSVGNPQPPGTTPPVKFSNAYNLRGFSVSKYGVASFINDASGFN
jgi:prepilin-type N-terminal cleavage/methylation domain-containing protein